eukprot:1523682-Rhodomonas_salina.1
MAETAPLPAHALSVPCPELTQGIAPHYLATLLCDLPTLRWVSCSLVYGSLSADLQHGAPSEVLGDLRKAAELRAKAEELRDAIHALIMSVHASTLRVTFRVGVMCAVLIFAVDLLMARRPHACAERLVRRTPRARLTHRTARDERQKRRRT